MLIHLFNLCAVRAVRYFVTRCGNCFVTRCGVSCRGARGAVYRDARGQRTACGVRGARSVCGAVFRDTVLQYHFGNFVH